MARPLRIEYPGAVYHVTSRGNAREAIFLSDADRRKFLDVLADTVEKYNWLCHAFCLLDNHYHLVVETPDPNLSLGMRQLNGVYTQSFNRIHQKVGHVFQGRYKAILVEKESHLLELCRYVVLNPVRAGMVSRPDEWKWSSYKSTAYAGTVPDYLTIDWVLGQFSEKKLPPGSGIVNSLPTAWWSRGGLGKNLLVKFFWEAKVSWRAWRNFSETSEK